MVQGEESRTYRRIHCSWILAGPDEKGEIKRGKNLDLFEVLFYHPRPSAAGTKLRKRAAQDKKEEKLD